MVLNAVQRASGSLGGDPYLGDIGKFMADPFADDYEHYVAVGAIPLGSGWYAGLQGRPDADELAVIWHRLCQAFGKQGAPQPSFLDPADDLGDLEMAIFAAAPLQPENK